MFTFCHFCSGLHSIFICSNRSVQIPDSQHQESATKCLFRFLANNRNLESAVRIENRLPNIDSDSSAEKWWFCQAAMYQLLRLWSIYACNKRLRRLHTRIDGDNNLSPSHNKRWRWHRNINPPLAAFEKHLQWYRNLFQRVTSSGTVISIYFHQPPHTGSSSFLSNILLNNNNCFGEKFVLWHLN